MGVDLRPANREIRELENPSPKEVGELVSSHIRKHYEEMWDPNVPEHVICYFGPKNQSFTHPFPRNESKENVARYMDMMRGYFERSGISMYYYVSCRTKEKDGVDIESVSTFVTDGDMAYLVADFLIRKPNGGIELVQGISTGGDKKDYQSPEWNLLDF